VSLFLRDIFFSALLYCTFLCAFAFYFVRAKHYSAEHYFLKKATGKFGGSIKRLYFCNRLQEAGRLAQLV
jgi:hypothetical protein